MGLQWEGWATGRGVAHLRREREVLAGVNLLVFVASPPARRRPVELGSTGHAVMVGNDCEALFAHVLLAIGDQTLLAVRVKAGLVAKARWLIGAAHHCSTVSCIFPQRKSPTFQWGSKNKRMGGLEPEAAPYLFNIEDKTIDRARSVHESG
jgi:hypothetical protein